MKCDDFPTQSDVFPLIMMIFPRNVTILPWNLTIFPLKVTCFHLFWSQSNFVYRLKSRNLSSKYWKWNPSCTLQGTSSWFTPSSVKICCDGSLIFPLKSTFEFIYMSQHEMLWETQTPGICSSALRRGNFSTIMIIIIPTRVFEWGWNRFVGFTVF